MNIKFLNADNLVEGISILSEELNFIYTNSENSDFTIELKEINDDKLIISLKENYATISFNKKPRFFRGLAYVVDCFKNGIKEKELIETPLFKTNGAMVDMSRNAVMTVKNVKLYLRKMALMGLNTFMLYTEDTYEIEEYPFFGHLRGRYSKAELKELDAYALKLGIELIPCIQTLGHLATHLTWDAANKYKDGASTLLVGSDETYKLINAMFKTLTECFTSKRVHIGMDETFDLGIGQYLNKNGYRERADIFLEHMAKVKELAFSYGLKPMMWSDMIFRHAGKNITPYEDYHVDITFTPEIVAKIPKGVQPVFWDYYHARESWYDINFKKHQEIFEEETMFAGGVWLWSGYCPLYSLSFRNTIPALDAAKANNAKEVIATIWLNGAEASHIMSLPGLAWYASYDYCGGFDMNNIKETFRISCNGNYDDMMLFELPEKAIKGSENCTRPFLYSDPLLGIFDYHLPMAKEYYQDVTKKLKDIKVDSLFKSAADTIIALSDVLTYKGDFGLRLVEAYKNGNKEELKPFIDECDIIAEKMSVLRDTHRKCWFEFNKTFGWEVFDIRYGGITNRIETAKSLLTQYINNEIESIDALEEPRLCCTGNASSSFCWKGYIAYATTGILGKI